MSHRLVDLLCAMAGVAAPMLVSLAVVWLKFRRVKGRVTAARRFAERLGLAALPPEAADRLGRRLYRRTMVRILFVGIGFSIWFTWYFHNTLLRAETEPNANPAPPLLYLIPVWALVGLVPVVGHVYDLMRSSPETGTRVARVVNPPVSDAVPPFLTWLLRTIGLLPAAAACVWFFVPVSVQHSPHAAHPHPLLFALAALSGPLSVAVTEAGQRRILGGRQYAATVRELAFDDALRVQTMMSVMIVPWVLCTAIASWIVFSLGRRDSWSGALPIYMAMSVGLMLLFLLPLLLESKWAHRHYLKRFAC